MRGRERKRSGGRAEGDRERENPKQTSCWAQSLTQSFTLQTQDHDSSQNQELDSQLTEPLCAPQMIFDKGAKTIQWEKKTVF